jgi:hypothetical protein
MACARRGASAGLMVEVQGGTSKAEPKEKKCFVNTDDEGYLFTQLNVY